MITPMVKFYLFFAIILISKTASSQITYQSGSYGKQKQKEYTIISGNLLSKFTKNGFNWLLLQNKGKVYTVNVVDTTSYKNYEHKTWIVLNNCFAIETQKSNMKY
ncbi:hypothetical protein [Pedobacter sp. Leaf170]|uniref:hypothetical protein n=1 Tax=Pedobacter sp. Leaf170 TaxID=2876558 RepID=UPI001E632AC4|nr:hypothetical protein [Pedobacter sp. Leaf170]